jgi:cytidyltransferase-like protein
MLKVVTVGSFDDLRSAHIRFLEEASKLGRLHVLLWSDEVVGGLIGSAPKFPEQERAYLVAAVRYVDELTLVAGEAALDPLSLARTACADVWALTADQDSPRLRAAAEADGIAYHVVAPQALRIFPAVRPDEPIVPSPGRKVVASGCFDWLHSGHVRFFEEVAGLGSLYVVVGHNENIRLLKGAGHPLLPQEERRYAVGSIRHVTQALVSTGHGWLDAEPEIARLRPDLYAVNEDGDRPEKRAFCKAHGIEYVVLKRLPREGLPRRESTALRGF